MSVHYKYHHQQQPIHQEFVISAFEKECVKLSTTKGYIKKKNLITLHKTYPLLTKELFEIGIKKLNKNKKKNKNKNNIININNNNNNNSNRNIEDNEQKQNNEEKEEQEIETQREQSHKKRKGRFDDSEDSD